MKNLEKKIVFITGATSGIGKSAAYQFAALGADLILAARREDRLDEISKELESKYGIETIVLSMDIQNYEFVKYQIDKLEGRWKNIDILLNNAGLARGMGSVKDGLIEDWNEMIDTNIKRTSVYLKMRDSSDAE